MNPSNFDMFDPLKGGDLLASFLKLHPGLTRLRFSVGSIVAMSPSLRVSLPNLQHYDGPAGPITALDVRGLKEAKISWNSGETSDTYIDNTIKALNLLTSPDIGFISSHEYCDPCCMSIVTSVSNPMQYTRTLRMRSLMDFDLLLDHDTIRHITECLPRFTGLVYLAMDWCIGIFSTSGANMDMDRSAVEAWGAACPTLEACCLNHHAWRQMDGTWEEYPMLDFRMLAGLPDLGY
ncbi:hypothetical protein B0H17DRAFT_1140452 [Mycena rosella]|uniref:Uncharacterized protein n=1 Tax=Mycena rosella TaxID=1033263 RepID=A0AAD7D297_MYCRO|nr:hypothetical protein B0H17DRAFT_1140452 [Mycena rosella]